MSKPPPEPDVAALLQMLHQQVDRQDGAVHFEQASTIQRISDRAAALAGASQVQPDILSVLQMLRREADELSGEVRFRDVGTVQRVGEGVATLSGLPRARTDEVVIFPTGVQGLIINLDHDLIDVILLGPDEGIQGGDLVTSTGERLRVPVGYRLLGRVINPLGEPLDGRGPVAASEFHYLERDAPGIIERAPVHEPLHTGLKIVDALVPIGCGQRELILGDRQTGKTTLAIDAILNQRESGVLCVYVAIGQKKSSTLAVIETLRRHGALPYTIVVVSSPDDPPALRYLAPYAGCTMAEFLVYEGHNVLIVYDDLTKHADTYRELSLLLRRPPGREAISINDGQIVLDTEMFNRGIKPAVNVGLSVSRVGGVAQTAAMRAVARHLRLELAQFEEVARFTRFGTEVDEATQRQIQRGERLQAALRQPPHRPLSLAAQTVILLAAVEGFLDDVPPEDIPAFESGLLARLEAEQAELLHQIERSGELSEETRQTLMAVFADYRATWAGGNKR